MIPTIRIALVILAPNSDSVENFNARILSQNFYEFLIRWLEKNQELESTENQKIFPNSEQFSLLQSDGRFSLHVCIKLILKGCLNKFWHEVSADEQVNR